MVSIYTLNCPITGEPIYVGKTIRKLKRRLDEHCRSSRLGKIYLLGTWIKSLHQQSLRPSIQLLSICNESEWQEEERFYINYLRFLGFELKNIAPGGAGSGSGLPMPEEQKIRISKTLMGHGHSEETRKRISEGLKGNIPYNKGKKGLYKCSEESKLKHRNAMKGRVRSEEHKKNLSIALKGRKVSKETRLKISEIQTGRKLTEQWKNNIGKALKGFKHTEESKENMRLSQTGRPKHTEESKSKIRYARAKQIMIPKTEYEKSVHSYNMKKYWESVRREKLTMIF